MPAVMGTNLKKIKVFIDKYGQIREGSIYETNNGNVVGRVPGADRLPEESGADKEKKEE